MNFGVRNRLPLYETPRERTSSDASGTSAPPGGARERNRHSNLFRILGASTVGALFLNYGRFVGTDWRNQTAYMSDIKPKQLPVFNDSFPEVPANQTDANISENVIEVTPNNTIARRDEDAICYATRYPDLYRGYCLEDLTQCNLDGLEMHYQEHGPRENRTWGCDASSDKDFQEDTFLHTVRRDQRLPECKSGSDFLSVEGGRWIEDASQIKNKRLFEKGKGNPRFLGPCQNDAYQDTYVWSSKCAIPAIPGQLKASPKRVLLMGDSLHYQMMSAIATQAEQIREDHVPHKASLHKVQFNMRQFLNPMLTSVPFKSSLCSSCDDAIGKALFGDEIVPLSEEKFVNYFQDYDFIFYNEFAHFVFKFITPLHEIYMGEAKNQTNYDDKHLTKLFMNDAFDYFERQMTRKAELLKSTGAKVYFRTSSPHAYDNPTMYANLTDLSVPQQRPANDDIPLMKCGSFNGDRHGAACYAAVNDIASRAFQSQGLGVLDAAKMLSQRVDAHPGSVPNSGGVDLLHFCQPGPLSAVVAGMLTEVYARSAQEV